MFNATELYPTPEIGGKIHDYCLVHSTTLPKHIDAHYEDTIEWAARESSDAYMMINPLQAKFLLFLGKLLGAKRVLEVGTYTGYSALVWAEVVKGAEGGRVVCLDIPCKSTEFAKQTFQNTGLLDGIITVVEGDGKASLQTLPEEKFDIVFLDANKDDYIACLDIILDRDLLAPGGVILADNTLKRALVVGASEQNPASADLEELWPSVTSVKAYNKHLLEDKRVEQFLLPVFDGLSMARRV